LTLLPANTGAEHENLHTDLHGHRSLPPEHDTRPRAETGAVLLSALSLLLCVAVVVLWVRSHLIADNVDHINVQRGWYMNSATGLVYVIRHSYPEPPPSDLELGWEWNEFGAVTPQLMFSRRFAGWEYGPVFDPRGMWDENERTRWKRLGFYHYRQEYEDLGVFRLVAAPHWAIAAILLPLPAMWLCRRVREVRRRRSGLCPACSYDLRATPERCPECGSTMVHEAHSSCASSARR
jgi:hypothetical protein